MNITRANENDLIEILYLLKVCISDMHSKGLKHWNNAYPDIEIIKKDLREGSVYLLKDRQVCKGMVTLSASEPEAYRDIKWPDSTLKPLYMHRMAVHPKWQRQGLARKLIRFAGDYAKKNGYRRICLDVFSNSENARLLYEKCEFVEVGAFHMNEQKIPYICYEKYL